MFQTACFCFIQTSGRLKTECLNGLNKLYRCRKKQFSDGIKLKMLKELK